MNAKRNINILLLKFEINEKKATADNINSRRIVIHLLDL